MSTIYVRSTDGNNADSGATWALAKADLVGAAAIDAAGDVIYVSQSHAESTAAPISLVFAGTDASPTRVICGNDAAEPPTTQASTATVTTTGSSNITMSGANLYMRGITFNVATGTGTNYWTPSSSTGSTSVFESCNVNMVNTGSVARIDVLAGVSAQSTFRNCTFKFSNASQGLKQASSGKTYMDGCSIASGGTSPSTIFLQPGSAAYNRLDISGFDASNCSSSVNIFTAGKAGRYMIRNSKLPASWSGSLVTGTLTANERYELFNCDDGDTNYTLQIVEYAGSIIDGHTVVRTGGASDGTTAMTWKMVTGSNAEYPHITLDTPEIVAWNETIGSSLTATIEIVTDNVTLTDAECWLEIQYLGTSGYPLGTFADDAKSDVLASAANQTTSSETWTTTGLTTPVKQKLSVTFTPQEKGFIHAIVKLAKVSTTVYVDPKLTVA